VVEKRTAKRASEPNIDPAHRRRMSSSELSVKKHTSFLVRCLRGMPSEATSLDSNRSVSSLHFDMLGRPIADLPLSFSSKLVMLM
jgi:hypothetical protein